MNAMQEELYKRKRNSLNFGDFNKKKGNEIRLGKGITNETKP